MCQDTLALGVVNLLDLEYTSSFTNAHLSYTVGISLGEVHSRDKSAWIQCQLKTKTHQTFGQKQVFYQIEHQVGQLNGIKKNINTNLVHLKKHT